MIPTDFQEHKIDILLEKLITNQLHGQDITDAFIYIACKVYNDSDEKVKNMLSSPDKEVAYVGEQMLFTDYLDLYNTLTKNQFYKTILSSIIKVLPSLQNAYETNEN
jgi:hypothetical protein